ncbi:hypothetical protein ACFWP0_10665 [Achromobacter sp. NPDC058515]|uniref:hypothetical protein n=1 Tax=Achromobacter sp. NPDC058515 TaxID=3346533 RepID=UPI0036596C2A
MIPIALPSASFYILISLGFLAGIVLLGWGLVLAASVGARRKVRKYWKTSVIAFVPLALLFGYYAWVQAIVWHVGRESDRQAAARLVTLQQPQTLGGIAMPAGTRLQLQDEGQLETYVEAEFPHAVPMYGMEATHARRYLGTDYDKDTYATIARYPRSVILRGIGDQSVQGWQCDAGVDVEFDSERDGAMKALRTCQLAQGNRLGDMEIAAGSTLYGSDGTVYVDGSRDPDRWRIEVRNPVAVQAFGLMLSEPTLYLDADRRLLRFADAKLACPTRFGDFSYSAGTHVKTARRNGAKPEPYPGVLVFSPWDGGVARRAGQEDVGEGKSVMQTLDGKLAGIVPNEEAGVFQYATFVVDGKEPARPALARCP